MYDIIIIGSGSAGLTAAIYAKRAQLSVLVAEKEHMGTGQIAVTERVDNYPGLYGISGFDLGESFRKHAEELGAEFCNGEVTKIGRDGKNWRVDFADGVSAEGIRYTRNGETFSLAVDGVFAAVGSVPNSQLLNGICELDGSGYVAAGEDCKTSAEGLFAAGDVRTAPLRQVITAAADGANAAISGYIDGSEYEAAPARPGAASYPT